MSGEIIVTLGLRCSHGSFAFAQGPEQSQIDQTTAAGGNPGTVSVGTSEGAIAFTGLTAPGYVWLKNLDDTNYVEYGPESAGAMVKVGKLKPGESALFRLAAGVTLRAKADTAACLVQIHALDD